MFYQTLYLYKTLASELISEEKLQFINLTMSEIKGGKP
jgi:hypothetical protein